MQLQDRLREEQERGVRLAEEAETLRSKLIIYKEIHRY